MCPSPGSSMCQSSYSPLSWQWPLLFVLGASDTLIKQILKNYLIEKRPAEALLVIRLLVLLHHFLYRCFWNLLKSVVFIINLVYRLLVFTHFLSFVIPRRMGRMEEYACLRSGRCPVLRLMPGELRCFQEKWWLLNVVPVVPWSLASPCFSIPTLSHPLPCFLRRSISSWNVCGA